MDGGIGMSNMVADRLLRSVDFDDDADARDVEIAALRERLRQTDQRLLGIQQISQIGQFLASDLDLDQVLEDIGRRTAALMECERATLYLVTEDRRSLTARLVGPDQVHVIELGIGQGIAGWVAEHGRPINVKDAYRDPRFDPGVDLITRFRTRSLLAQPIRDRHERPIGVLQTLNKRGDDGYFSTVDETLLETIASQAAVVIRNSRLFIDLAKKHHTLLDTQVRLQERNSEMDLMFTIERAAAVARGLDEALDGALQATLSEYPCAAAAVMLLADDPDVAPETKRWRVRRAAGDDGGLLEQASGVAAEPLLAEALVYGRQLVLFDDPELPTVPKLLMPFTHIETLVVIPLLWREREEGAADGDADTSRERPLGALVLVNSLRFPKGFDELDRHKLGVIASRMALSVTLGNALEEERKAERMAAIGGALSGIVHDLRTPLTLLDGYARLLSRTDDATDRQELRDKHKRQIAVVNGMIHDVLAFARGQSQVLPRKLWMRDFMSDLEEMLQIELAGSRVTHVVDDRYRGSVRMDDAKMKRVMTNLVRNAREAMADAGGQITIAAEADPNDATRVLLRVTDTGPGIPAEMEGRLFQSFATHGKAQGTGLGLAIVKTIVDQHDGTLSVRSKPGVGTTFEIGLSIE